MGEVYRARDERLKRDVAIKVLPASFSTDADRLRRFEQEAQAAGSLNHPNITAVYDIGTHEGAPYLVQELLEGETLRSALSGGRLAPRRAIDYALQTAHGLAAAHEKGIVHRDLKPENVFVTKDGRIKILDFGLAKLTRPEDAKTPHSRLPTETAGTEPGVVLGTIAYMSPEQARGQPADARSDLFSFGAVLFEMLSGARPFSGGTAADTMSSILREDPPDVSTVSPGVSTALEMIVRHCLEKSVEQRFQSARDLAFALEAISIGPGASSAAIAAAAVPKRPSRQGAWILAGALALAAAAFFAGRNLRPAAPGPPALRFLTTSGRDGQPAVSPDGKIIAFVSSRTGLPRIWLKQLSGGAEVALTEGPDNFPRFSPDGSEVLFTRTESGKPILYRIASVGGTPRRILEGALDADWSPDGRHIAFVGQQQPRTSANVGVVRADGSGSRVLAEFKNFGAHSPRWSPDGRSICAAVGIGRQP
jgi:eukaryotic-like serine/threonine-protein kinase